jgi:hypothetical protein
MRGVQTSEKIADVFYGLGLFYYYVPKASPCFYPYFTHKNLIKSGQYLDKVSFCKNLDNILMSELCQNIHNLDKIEITTLSKFYGDFFKTSI